MGRKTSKRANLLADLMRQTAAGNERAFGRLYSETSPQLFAQIVRIVKQETVAEEMLQEVYIKVWHKAGQYDPAKAGVSTWLGVIARNRALDEIRGHKQERVVDFDLDNLPGSTGAEPASVAEQDAIGRELSLCLNELEAQQRKTILLAYYEGLTHKELAARLGSPLGTVKSWVRRGLIRLKECLEKENHRAAY